MSQATDGYALAGKVAVVTGGGKGLGKTLAAALLSEGMTVAICGRRTSVLASTTAEFEAAHPGRVFGRTCDVSDAAQVETFAEAVQARHGPVQVLINNSGFGKDTRVWETSEADWDAVMDTNVKGAWLMCRALLPAMIEAREGYILNIASQAALNGYAKAGVYCASKFALVGLGKALQEEVREYGIHVHSLNPALIQSQKTDGEPVDPGQIQNEDLARLAVYLLQQPRRLKIDNVGLWGF